MISEDDLVLGGYCPKCGADFIDCKCAEDSFKNIKEAITKSTKQSGYSVYIPEEAKKQEETITWDDILDEYVKIYTNPHKRDFENLFDFLKENYNTPKNK
jgi:hypothetical protein